MYIQCPSFVPNQFNTRTVDIHRETATFGAYSENTNFYTTGEDLRRMGGNGMKPGVANNANSG